MQYFYCLLIIPIFSISVFCQSDTSSTAAAHTWELQFGEPDVRCDQKEICYDILIKSKEESFIMGDFDLHFFYDASVASIEDAQVSGVPQGYSLDEGIQVVRGGNLYQFGDLPYDQTMHLASIQVRKDAMSEEQYEVGESSEPLISGICFQITEPNFFGHDDYALNMTWVNSNTKQNYTKVETQIFELGVEEPTDAENSSFISPKVNENTFDNVCTDKSQVSNAGYTLELLGGNVNCAKNQVCYNIEAKAQHSAFFLGNMDLYLLYDASKLKYTNGSIEIPESETGYSLGEVQDELVNADLSHTVIENEGGLLRLPISYDNTKGGVILHTSKMTRIANDLCFQVKNPNVFTDPLSCPKFEWLTADNRASFSSATTKVYHHDDRLVNAYKSSYTDLSGCLEGMCQNLDAGFVGGESETAIQFALRTALIQCNTKQICFDVTAKALNSDFNLGSYAVRLFYGSDDFHVDFTQATLPMDGYKIINIESQYGGDLSDMGDISFDDQLGLFSALINFKDDENPIPLRLNTKQEKIILQNVCFEQSQEVVDNCLNVEWVTAMTSQGYTTVSTSMNLPEGVSIDLTGSTYLGVDSRNGCIEDFCSALAIDQSIEEGLTDSNGQTVSFYPNPTVNTAQISLEGFQYTGAISIDIMDLEGRILRSNYDLKNTRSIDLVDFESGLYIIRTHLKDINEYKYSRVMKID